MFVDSLTSKLSDSIDELGGLLDLIHKFSQAQRKQYYDKIQSLKNQLMLLKTNLKQANALQTEKQYNTVYLALNTLKGQIQGHNSIVVCKENRSVNQSGFIRQTKKTYEQALKLVAMKEDEISQLKLALFEKEQLIKMTYQELRDYQRDCSFLSQQNKIMKNDIFELEREITALTEQLNQKENETTDLRLSSQGQERQLRISQEALEQSSNELMLAKERLLHFQQLAEISMKKTSLVEENIRRVEEEASFLNESYKKKEEETIKRQKLIEQMKLNSKLGQKRVYELEQQNARLRKEIQLVEEEIIDLQKSMEILRRQNGKLTDDFSQEYRLLRANVQKEENERRSKQSELREIQSKFMVLYSKFQEGEQERLSLIKDLQNIRGQEQDYLLKLRDLESQICQKQRQISIMVKQNSILHEQIEKTITVNKECEVTVEQFQQKIKKKEMQKYKLSVIIQNHELRSKQQEQKRLAAEHDNKVIAEELAQCRSKMYKLQQNCAFLEKIIVDLKKKLLKSKIEVIREIRSELSD